MTINNLGKSVLKSKQTNNNKTIKKSYELYGRLNYKIKKFIS